MSCGTCGIQASDTMQEDTGVPAGAPTTATRPRCPRCRAFIAQAGGLCNNPRCPTRRPTAQEGASPIPVGTVTYADSPSNMGLLRKAGVDRPWLEIAAECLARHQRGDWGDIGHKLRAENEQSVRLGVGDIMSFYPIGNGRAVVRVLTTQDRDADRQQHIHTRVSLLPPRPGTFALDNPRLEQAAQDIAQQVVHETGPVPDGGSREVFIEDLSVKVYLAVGAGRGKPAQRNAVLERVRELLEQQGFQVRVRPPR